MKQNPGKYDYAIECPRCAGRVYAVDDYSIARARAAAERIFKNHLSSCKGNGDGQHR